MGFLAGACADLTTTILYASTLAPGTELTLGLSILGLVTTPLAIGAASILGTTGVLAAGAYLIGLL